MEIHSVGYHHIHGKDFVIDRPEGCGWSWLFLLFKSPALVRIDGKEILVKENTFLLYSSLAPEYYRAHGEAFINDWFHFTVEPVDELLFRELAIPLNRPVALESTEEISMLIRSMTYEFYTGNLYSADLVDLYLKTLFFKLSRLLHSNVRSLPESSASRYDSMIHLREDIYRNIRNVGTVSEMARNMSMSQSAFQHTYKKIFGTNVMADVNRARIQQAQTLLATTNLPLRQIAEQSGYSSEFHLMRHFKSHTGLTPTEYRKKSR